MSDPDSCRTCGAPAVHEFSLASGQFCPPCRQEEEEVRADLDAEDAGDDNQHTARMAASLVLEDFVGEFERLWGWDKAGPVPPLCAEHFGQQLRHRMERFLALAPVTQKILLARDAREKN